MLASYATNPLNHILRNESWACKRLQSYEGKTVCIRIPPFVNLKMIVQPNGELSHYQDNLQADATLSILPTLLPRLLAHEESAYDAIDISGDTAFAEDLITIGKHLKPNFEQELGRIFGDVPAHRIVQAGETIFQWHINLVNNISESLGEYWQEEHPMIAKENEVKRFSHQIEELERDVNQIETRINRIIQQKNR